MPTKVTLDYLLDLGQDVLKAKIRSVEEFGMKYGKKRIPEKLDFDDVAIILMAHFRFKNIQMTEREEDTILAVYMHDESSARYGTYITTKRYMYELMERIAPNFTNREMHDVLDKVERSVLTVQQTKDRHPFVSTHGI